MADRPDSKGLALAKMIHIPAAVGEVIDKITILTIKLEHVDDAAKRANVQFELDLLRSAFSEHVSEPQPEVARLTDELYKVNQALWAIEDRIRTCEATKTFDDEFIVLARAVYTKNDRRAALKRRLSTMLGSTLIEEKTYAAY